MRPLRLLPLLALPLLAGCSASVSVGGLDIPKIEREAKSVIEKQTGARIKSVDCPDGQKEKQGENFLCRATGTDGSKGDVTITQKDDDGNVSIAADYLHVREAEDEIAKGIAKQTNATSLTVRCPEIIRGRAGGTFDCALDGSGGKATVRSTFTDNDGNFNYKVLDGGGG